MTVVVCTPLRVERLALAGALSAARVVRSGSGARLTATARQLLAGQPSGVLVAGVGGGVALDVRPGDVVVADAVRASDGAGDPVPVESAPLLVGALRRAGVPARAGVVVTSERLVHGQQREDFASAGVLAVDMETMHVAHATAGRPFAALRAIVDTANHPLMSTGTAARGVVALRRLRQAAPVIDDWSRALGEREIHVVKTRDVSAVTQLARGVEIVLVTGSPTSPDATPLVERAHAAGTAAHLVERADDVELAWLIDVARVGVVADDAAAEVADAVVRSLSGLGRVHVRVADPAPNDVPLTMPEEVR